MEKPQVVEVLERQARMIEARNEKLRAIISDNNAEIAKIEDAIRSMGKQAALPDGDCNF